MRKLFTLAALALTMTANAQLANIEMEPGRFQNNWQSLGQWECPEWFQDAKFGLWAHWGPQCQANSGDWYARYMYDGQTHWDQEKNAYINCKEYGFKEYCRDWKADKWDPEAIMEKYAAVGAKYFFALANHHDNFDCWDSPYQEWNCVNMGPKKDLGKGWAEACRKRGIKFGMSVHASHAWTWYEIGRKYGDVRLTKADGVGQWWEGYDPNELYAQAHEQVSSGWDNIGNIHNQWNWNNGASIPDEAYKTKLQNRCRQMVQALEPDVIYFDDTVLPFWGCDNQWGQDFLAYYYNYMSNRGKDVVCCAKVLQDMHKDVMLWDVERGIPDRPQRLPWQTDTCIGGWHYSYSDRGHYKSAATVIRMLIDIVSKNGNLMLSVPLKGEGTYDEQEADVLDGIQHWMEINGESIYGTRVWWDCFGEGPLAEASNAINGQGFNEGQNYSSQDVRYVTTKDESLIYATIMAWPAAGEYTMKAFSPVATSYKGEVESVYLLGYGEVPFKQSVKGLVIDIPSTHPDPIAPAFRISFKEGKADSAEMLQTIINDLSTIAEEAQANSSYTNSGKYNTIKAEKLALAIELAKAADKSDEQSIKDVRKALVEAYQDFEKNGMNQSGLWSGSYKSNLTTTVLVQASAFKREAGGTSRFGKPANWTVENFNIPNGGDGTKQGLDKYSGQEALMLGVWNDRASNKEGDLSNARIYRKVQLAKGLYYFGAAFNAVYSLSDQAYMFVSPELSNTADIPAQSLAYYRIKNASTGSNFYGLWVDIPEDMEVCIGFQADLNLGSDTQEFRAEKVVFYKLAAPEAATLTTLTNTISKKLVTIEPKLKFYNTGFYSPIAYTEMKAKNDAIVASMETMTDNEVKGAYYTLKEAWDEYQVKGQNLSGLFVEEGTDITEEKLGEARNFTRTDPESTTRFGQPAYWTVENFSIPNGASGTKAGLDKYSGSDALMLGIWDDRQNNAGGSSKLANARIYKKVMLDAGCYYFGAAYNANYSLSKAYIYVNPELLTTTTVEKNAMAYLSIGSCPISSDAYGIYFMNPEPQELYLCFQANLASGSTTQEFRAETVKLVKIDNPTAIAQPQAPATPAAKGIYGIDGVRRDTLQKGINIVNGKKILVK